MRLPGKAGWWIAFVLVLTTGLAVVAVVLIAQTGDESAETRNVQVVPTGQAMSNVEEYAHRIVTDIGNTTLEGWVASSARCEGRRGELSDTVYSMTGFAQIPVPLSENLVAVLERLRDRLQQQGFTVTTFRADATIPAGELVVDNPADGYSIFLTSTRPPTMLALSIHSPCYRSPTPLE